MGQAMADALRTALDKSHNGKQDKRAGAEKLVEMAGGGNLEATKLLFERTNGKVPEMRIHVGDDGAPPIRYVEVGDWRSGARAGRRGSSSRSGPTGASGSTSTRDRRGLGVARHASWPSWPVCSIMNRSEVRPSGPTDGARRGEALHQDHPAFAVAEQTGGGARLALTVGPPRSGNRPTRALQETGWVRVEPNAFRVALRGYAFYSPAKGIVWAAELAIRAFPVSGHAVVIDATNTTRHRRARWLRIPATSGRRQRPSGMDTRLAECLKHNLTRRQRVPEEVMERTFRQWEPVEEEGLAIRHAKGRKERSWRSSSRRSTGSPWRWPRRSSNLIIVRLGDAALSETGLVALALFGQAGAGIAATRCLPARRRRSRRSGPAG